MSLLHNNSSLCVSSQLDLFALPGTQTSQEKGSFVQHYPISTLDDGPIQFEIKPSPLYTDLADTRLYIRARITGTENIADAQFLSPVNMLMHALFSKVDVHVGNRLITQSSSTYPWKAAIETLLNFGGEAKGSHLQNILYYKDTAGHMDDTDPGNHGNQGLTARHGISYDGRAFEMYGPLHVDFFFQPKYLISNVPVRVKLTRSPASFVLMATQNFPNINALRVEITDASLWVRRIQVSPSVELAHAKVMQKANALYPIHRVETETMPIPVGTRTITKDNFFSGKLPRRLILAMLSNEAFNGSFQHTPFNFKTYGLESVELTVDGENVAGTPLNCDFQGGLYCRAYDNMFSSMQKAYKDAGIDISYSDFASGYALFCFDLTPDGCGACNEHFEVQRNGNLRMKLRFAAATTETINILVYGEFDSVIEITKEREVLMEYST